VRRVMARPPGADCLWGRLAQAATVTARSPSPQAAEGRWCLPRAAERAAKLAPDCVYLSMVIGFAPRGGRGTAVPDEPPTSPDSKPSGRERRLELERLTR
jgi:hypothetical protein